MSALTIALSVLAFAVSLARGQEMQNPVGANIGSDPTPTATSAPSMTTAVSGTSPSPSLPPHPPTAFKNALPYCTFGGGKISCAPLTTHQRLFLILIGVICLLLFILIITLCCCCCRRRRAPRPEIFVSSIETAQPSSSHYSYGGQAPYGNRLNGQRYAGTDSKGKGVSQGAYGSQYSRT